MIELIVEMLKDVDLNKVSNLGIFMMMGLFELNENNVNEYKFKAALNDGTD